MSRVTVDKATGALRIAGAKVFPLGLSNGPPADATTPDGRNGFAEIAGAGVTFVRTGRGDWSLGRLEEHIAAERAVLDAAAAHGLQCWLYLGELPDLPPRAAGAQASAREQMLTRIAASLKGHPGLGAYKGVDEPRNPFRGERWIRPAGLVRAARRLKALDPQHPLVIVQAPRSPVTQLTPYRPAFDITGADIFPIAYPPGEHSDLPSKDIGVVGDVTRKMVRAAGGKPVWMTLQIAWSGTVTSARRPNVVPRFPTLHELRFMTYQAIACGARGLTFFGGHLTQVSRPIDSRAGWNWTFWEQALRPLVEELGSTAVAPALVAPDAKPQVKPTAKDVDAITRRDGRFLYVIAARRGGATSRVGFTGLPKKLNGRPLAGGQVLFEYVQEPPPPIGAGRQTFRSVPVTEGGFRDWFGPHDVHVYRFAL
ncbi:MAG: hypothetical protein ACRDNB_04330 [Gaiellaceae bacterium]